MQRKEFDGTKVRKIRIWDNCYGGCYSYGFQLFDEFNNILAQTCPQAKFEGHVYTDTILKQNERIIGIKSMADGLFH